MDRVVKYRYWDEKAGKMLYCDKHNYYAYYGGIAQRIREKPTPGGFYEATLTGLPFYAVPLQLTGLKDKNGKGIYEGDVLKWPTAKKPFSVVYKDAAFRVSRSGWILRENGCEVIGNIYENPELAAA